jgi:MmyB-like transcription regulator ligand binding domain
MEQGRGPHPSRQVLGAPARALRLTDDERGHLFQLAGEQPGLPKGPPRDVPQGVLHLLDRLDDTPAYVHDAMYNVLAWNDLAAALVADFGALKERDRNIIRWACTYRGTVHDEVSESFLRDCLADLRLAAARYPDDPGVRALVAEVTAIPEFAAIWAEREVGVRRATTKRMNHPVVGPLELHCDVLLVPDRDQRVVLYTAAPGTPTYEALKLLKVVGRQNLRPSPTSPASVRRPAGT